MLLITLISAALAAGSVEPAREWPVMRVEAAGLDLSNPDDTAVFAARVAEQSRHYCALHIERITPQNTANPRLCERGMAQAAVRALPETHRLRFHRAGGRAQLHRRLD
jgi:UrcA family protein